jgi:hypothetical protein
MSTIGENWIKLLRGYGPLADNNATEAENVDSYTKLLKMERLSFRHPARDQLGAYLLNVAPDQRPTILISVWEKIGQISDFGKRRIFCSAIPKSLLRCER